MESSTVDNIDFGPMHYITTIPVQRSISDVYVPQIYGPITLLTQKGAHQVYTESQTGLLWSKERSKLSYILQGTDLRFFNLYDTYRKFVSLYLRLNRLYKDDEIQPNHWRMLARPDMCCKDTLTAMDIVLAQKYQLQMCSESYQENRAWFFRRIP